MLVRTIGPVSVIHVFSVYLHALLDIQGDTTSRESKERKLARMQNL